MNDPRVDVLKYAIAQALMAAASAHYLLRAAQSVIDGDPLPQHLTPQSDPREIVCHYRDGHKPLKRSEFYVRGDGSIGCHRDQGKEVRGERTALRMAKHGAPVKGWTGKAER